MDKELYRKELRKWAVEQALKLEFPLDKIPSQDSEFNRANRILQTANDFYNFVEEYENNSFLKTLYDKKSD